jgi:hypothetical protein
MRLNIPTAVALVLSLVAGVLAVLNVTTFQFTQPWHNDITVALVFLAAIGISPLVGPYFRNALHLTAAASVVITAVLMAASAAITTLNLSTDAKGIIVGILTFLAGIGFGPATGPVPAPPVA